MSLVARELKAAKKQAAEHAQEIETKWAEINKREENKGDATPEEHDEILEHVKAVNTCKSRIEELEKQKSVEDEIKRVSREMGPPKDEGEEGSPLNHISFPRQTKTIGEMFVESAEFKSIQAQGSGSRFSTGAVELDTKGTLLTGSGAPGTGTGGAFLTVPQVVPGVVEKLFQPLTIADIIATGTTNTNTIRYVVEGTATSGAAGVAEGGTKPESTLGLSTVDEPVKKVATVLHASDEMLEDAAQVQSYINGRLGLFVRIEEERELVLGAGTNELVGITGRSGVNTYAGGTVDNNAVVLFKALNGTRGSSFLEPDAIVMNPTDWQETRLLMDANQQFYGGGPFSGQYGNGGVDPISGQLTGATDSIWNKPVLVTTAIGAGTALLGAFRTAAQIFRKGGLTVEASNSHDLHFVRNLIAIRAEQRLALAVYRPSAFTKVLFQ